MVILRKMDIQGADVINEVLQTQPYIDEDELRPGQLVLLEGIEDIYDRIENHNMKISEQKSNHKIQNTKIDDDIATKLPTTFLDLGSNKQSSKIVELYRTKMFLGYVSIKNHHWDTKRKRNSKLLKSNRIVLPPT